jgi:hypothetical protein
VCSWSWCSSAAGPDLDEHCRRVTTRASDLPGLVYPGGDAVLDRLHAYPPRTDAGLGRVSK